MNLVEWITLGGVGVAVVGVVGTVVYSFATLKSEVKSMHKCQRLNLRLTAKNGRVLQAHIIREEKRFSHIENALGIGA